MNREQLLAQYLPIRPESPLDAVQEKGPYAELGEAIHVHISPAEYAAMPDSLKARLIQDETEPDW